jgi:hypothetical protein
LRYWLSIFHNHLHHFCPRLQFKGVWHLFHLRQQEVPVLITSKFLLKFSFHIKSLLLCHSPLWQTLVQDITSCFHRVLCLLWAFYPWGCRGRRRGIFWLCLSNIIFVSF